MLSDLWQATGDTQATLAYTHFYLPDDLMKNSPRLCKNKFETLKIQLQQIRSQ